MAFPLIVSTAWLHDQLASGSKNIRILDATWDSTKDCRPEYNEVHIPGALFFEIMKNVDHTPIFTRNIPSVEDFQDQVRSLGINHDTHVVIYDSKDKCGYVPSGRAWWMFKIFGCERVSVLDGGLVKWMKDGFEVTSEINDIQPGDFTANRTPRDNTFYRTFEQMRENVSSLSEQVLDNRSSAQYKNTAGEAYKGGHIPGALNIPFDTVLDKENGVLKSTDALKEVFTKVGFDLSRPVVTMCNSGMSSCSMALIALVGGFPSSAVFHGGWTEYKQKASEEMIEK